MMNPRPPFMNGLLTARGVLVSLRQRKLKQQKQKQSKPRDENLHVGIESPTKIQKNLPSQPPEMIEVQPKLSKREELTQRINEIGQELYQINQENEAYQLIFHRLTEYYRENHKIVEENQHYKRKGFQLEEKIKEYKDKIKENYEKIQTSESQNVSLQAFLQESLEDYLRNEKERAMIEPLKTSSMSVSDILKGFQETRAQKDLHKDQKDEGMSISLNWRSLAQKTAKKTVARKPKASQDMREGLFNSQLYNI